MRILGNDRSGTRFFTSSVNYVSHSSVPQDFNVRSGKSPGVNSVLTNAHYSALCEAFHKAEVPSNSPRFYPAAL